MALAAALLASCSRTESPAPASPTPAESSTASTAPPDAAGPTASLDASRAPDAEVEDDPAVTGVPSRGPVDAEPSTRGRFVMRRLPGKKRPGDLFALDQCAVSFQPEVGAEQPLFVEPDCASGPPGIGEVGAVRRYGSVAFPVRAARDEVHLFQIALARGGNGAYGSSSWIVHVREGRGCDAGCASASVRSFVDPWNATLSLDVAPPNSADAPLLVLERASTRTEKGMRVEIATGPAFDLRKRDLPLLHVAVVSRVQRVVEHAVVSRGGRAENFRLTLGDGPLTMTLDEGGACDAAVFQGFTGRVKIEVTDWANGDTSVKCLRADHVER